MGGIFGVLLGSIALYKLRKTGHVSNMLNMLTKIQVHDTNKTCLFECCSLIIHMCLAYHQSCQCGISLFDIKELGKT